MSLSRAAVVAALSTLGVSACGGGSSTVAVHTSVRAPTTTQPRAAQTVTRTVTAPTRGPRPGQSSSTGTSPASAPSGSACVATDLVPVLLGQNGATGNIVLEVALRNRASFSCHTYGYPGVQFLSRSGSPLATDPTHTAQDLLGSTRKAVVTLAPGQEASFRMVADANGAKCSTAFGLRVIAPDDTAPMRLAIPGGAYECARTTVSPLESGSGAAPGV